MILELSILIPLTTGVSEVFKRWRKINNDDMPLTSLIIGIVLALIAFFTLPEGMLFGEALFMGIVAGLSGAGLYDNGKSALAKR